MDYKIIISPLGKATLQQNMDYLEKEWSPKEIYNFIQKTEGIIEILKNDPYIFPRWEHNNEIHRIPIIKQITLFYSIHKNQVELHLFWNNYQNPEKLLNLL